VLPKVDGLAILRRSRREGGRAPVPDFTASGGTDDVVRGLDLGSDEHPAGPFEMGELTARCRALIRRSYGRAASIRRAAGVEIAPRPRTKLEALCDSPVG
jgi:DNA-binding response OmpR family regulator